MLLAINIGNSNIRFGVFDNENEPKTWTLNTKPYKSEDESFSVINNLYLQYEIDIKQVTEIVIGSVVPRLTSTLQNALSHIHQKEIVVVDRNTPSNVIHDSSQIGTDLYANAVAAREISNKKTIIIDFGTALTFTCLDEKGKVLGVIISPGVNTSLLSLIGETAQLPDIELKLPKSVLGKDTESCMQSGLIYGFLSLIEGMLLRIKKELNQDCYVIATGGLGHVFYPLTDKIDMFDRLHTIKGIRRLYLESR